MDTFRARTLRIAALGGIVGVLSQLALAQLHAGHGDPNDSAHAFADYAASDIWTNVHIGQFAGTLLIALALLALARSVARDGGVPQALAGVATVTLVTLIAVFAVQMAVDGVALKAAADAWVAATDPTAKAVAYSAAETVRSIEKGLSAFFNLLNGTAILALGAAIVASRSHSRVVGAIGALTGLGFITGGIEAAHTGFSPEAAAILSPTALFLAVFLVGLLVTAWRAPRSAQQARRTVRHELAPTSGG
jgi:hypothetical protein